MHRDVSRRANTSGLPHRVSYVRPCLPGMLFTAGRCRQALPYSTAALERLDPRSHGCRNVSTRTLTELDCSSGHTQSHANRRYAGIVLRARPYCACVVVTADEIRSHRVYTTHPAPLVLSPRPPHESQRTRNVYSMVATLSVMSGLVWHSKRYDRRTQAGLAIASVFCYAMPDTIPQ